MKSRALSLNACLQSCEIEEETKSGVHVPQDINGPIWGVASGETALSEVDIRRAAYTKRFVHRYILNDLHLCRHGTESSNKLSLSPVPKFHRKLKHLGGHPRHKLAQKQLALHNTST